MLFRVNHIRLFIAFFAVGVASLAASAQQPFVTDDADTADKGKFELEVTNELDRLHHSAFPETYQNGTQMSLSYGLIKNVQVSIEGNFLGVFSRDDPRSVAGISDTTAAIKYNFRHERESSYLPAMAIVFFVQAPTGNAMRGLGSGVTNVGVNYIAQKTIGKSNVVRINGGFLFAGNTIIGQLGILSIRGHIFTGSASYTRQLTRKLQIGAEFSGAVTSKFELSAGQLQTRVGGSYDVNKKTTLYAALIAGKYSASPRFGLVLGFRHVF